MSFALFDLVGKCSIGVKTVHRILQIAFKEAVVTLKYLQRLMPCDPHDCQMVYPSPPHVCDSGVPKVMKSKSLKLRASARGLKCGLDGVNGFPVDQEDVWLLQVVNLIQVFEQSGQVSGPRHEVRTVLDGEKTLSSFPIILPNLFLREASCLAREC